MEGVVFFESGRQAPSVMKCGRGHGVFYMGKIIGSKCGLCGALDDNIIEKRLHCKACYTDFCGKCMMDTFPQRLGLKHLMVLEGVYEAYREDSLCGMYVSDKDLDILKKEAESPGSQEANAVKQAAMRERVYEIHEVYFYCFVLLFCCYAAHTHT